MKRREILKYVSLAPVAASFTTFLPIDSDAKTARQASSHRSPKRIAAILTEYRPNSHADVIVGKYLEGFNQDQNPPYPQSKIVSMFTEQVPENDMSRKMAAKYNVPIFRTVSEALTLGGDSLEVDGVLLIGEHGDYPMNDKEQKLYPRFEMFLKITDVFRETGKSVPVFNDKHLSWSWRQAKRMVSISRELNFPMIAGSSVPVAWRIPAIDTPFGIRQTHAVAISYSGLDIYGFHVLESLQAVVERRKGGETGVRSVQCFENDACWDFMANNAWVSRLFEAAISNSLTKKQGDIKSLVPTPTVFVIEYSDGLLAAAFLMTGLVEDFTVAVDVVDQDQPYATLMRLQPGKPHHHFGCLVKNIEQLFETGIPPYPVERSLLTSGILDFALESRFKGYKKLRTPELAAVSYEPSKTSSFCSQGWDEHGKRLD
ncbi:hypothetical protein [Lunatibacter salilacus]|uniref:hypothetical protein n=1 Tax=Lunatibacter salilacus TaxID=2483804 RepID=UPI00131D03B4|nr:hypothetical protein [Lunatibacter salilacus]